MKTKESEEEAISKIVDYINSRRMYRISREIIEERFEKYTVKDVVRELFI